VAAVHDTKGHHLSCKYLPSELQAPPEVLQAAAVRATKGHRSSFKYPPEAASRVAGSYKRCRQSYKVNHFYYIGEVTVASSLAWWGFVEEYRGWKQ
jgi:hypothetical protein